MPNPDATPHNSDESWTETKMTRKVNQKLGYNSSCPSFFRFFHVLEAMFPADFAKLLRELFKESFIFAKKLFSSHTLATWRLFFPRFFLVQIVEKIGQKARWRCYPLHSFVRSSPPLAPQNWPFPGLSSLSGFFGHREKQTRKKTVGNASDKLKMAKLQVN